MRFFCLYIPIFLFVSASLAQTPKLDKYHSTVADTYYARRARIYDKEYTPTPAAEVLSRKHTYINVISSARNNNPFKTIYEHSDYEEQFNKAYFHCLKKAARKNKKHSQKYSTTQLRESPCSQIFDLRYKEEIDNVWLISILRYDSIGTKHVFLYEGMTFDDTWGYWIAVSSNRGKTWKHYYTGLTKDNNYHIKVKSKLPLIKNDTVIQVEAAILRLVEPERLPTGIPEYELLKDGIVLELNLNKIASDTDKDGLTDIVEERLAINPLSSDTDGDSIPDSADMNPRYKTLDNKYTRLYNYILEIGVDKDSSIVAFTGLPDTIDTTSGKRNLITYMVVSDDVNLRSISSVMSRYIFLDEGEYEKYSQRYNVFNQVNITPLFPVDNMPGYYILTVRERISGITYLVIERDGYWVVKIIGMYIV